MATPNEIAGRMLGALAVSEPELDTGVGTPIRKIIDAVAEAMSEITIDAYLTTYQYDVDSRSGADLDSFAAMFGFYRILARRAHGTILLQRTTPAPESVIIQAGSQASTFDNYPVVVQTVVSAIFPRSGVVLEVPAEAIEGGSRGNLSAGAITRWMTNVEGVTSITNPEPFSGGSDVETDEQFRARLKKTIFRNLAGTKDMYLAIGLAQSDTLNAEVYSAYERWTERVEILGGTGSPSIATQTPDRSFTIVGATNASPSRVGGGRPHDLNIGDVVYISGATGNTAINGLRRVKWVDDHNYLYLEDMEGAAVNGNGAYDANTATCRPVNRMATAVTDSYAFGRSIDFNDIFPTTMYTVDFTAAPPVITVVDTESIPDGIYEFSFMYTSQGSRNHPNRTTGIVADRVDIWIDGDTAESASVVSVLDSANTMDEQTSGYAKGAYRRSNGDRPNHANGATPPLFLPLPLAPATTIPSALTLGAATYTEGTDYWQVERVTDDVRGSTEARSGIEFAVGEATNVQESITVVSTTDATPVVVTLSGAHRFAVGQRVRITGCSQATLNNDWYLSAVDGGAGTITLGDSTAPGGTGAGGTARLFHPVSIEYTFNAAPIQAQRSIEEWRLAGTNVLVHKAAAVPLKFFVAVILRPGYTVLSVQSPAEAVVRDVLRNAGIGGVVQISDILTALGGVSGIDSVRMLAGGDRTTVAVTAASTSGADALITTGTAHGLAQDDLVDLSGIVGATSLNGVWRVKSITSTTQFKVEWGYLNSAYVSGGTVRSGNFATQIMSPDGSRPVLLVADRSQTLARPIDIQANDIEHFTLSALDITLRAQNSWGVN
jgi:uncharacterized phage protein gp47/JayE